MQFGGEHARAIEVKERALAEYERRGLRAEAAGLARWLAFLYVSVHGNPAAANGWMARAESLLEGVRECAAHGWLMLDRAPGCSDASEREQLAAAAIAIASRYGDRDLVFDVDVAHTHTRRNVDTILSLVRCVGRGLRGRNLVLGERWQTLRVPTLFACGERDAFMRPKIEKAWEAITPANLNVRVLRIPDAGHLPWIDDPECVVAEIERFLATDKHESVAGSQYTSFRYSQTLDDAGVLASVGSVGDAYDNALAESFVDSFKTELIADRTWRTRSQLELAIVEYGGWFNTSRPHESLGDLPPAEYEALHAPGDRGTHPYTDDQGNQLTRSPRNRSGSASATAASRS